MISLIVTRSTDHRRRRPSEDVQTGGAAWASLGAAVAPPGRRAGDRARASFSSFSTGGGWREAEHTSEAPVGFAVKSLLIIDTLVGRYFEKYFHTDKQTKQ